MVKIKYLNRKRWHLYGLKYSSGMKTACITKASDTERLIMKVRSKLTKINWNCHYKIRKNIISLNYWKLITVVSKIRTTVKDIIKHRQSKVQCQIKINYRSVISNKQMLSEKFHDFFRQNLGKRALGDPDAFARTEQYGGVYSLCSVHSLLVLVMRMNGDHMH